MLFFSSIDDDVNTTAAAAFARCDTVWVFSTAAFTAVLLVGTTLVVILRPAITAEVLILLDGLDCFMVVVVVLVVIVVVTLTVASLW